MSNASQPVEAPVGYKWVISSTRIEDIFSGAPCMSLGLWDENVSVDAHGMGWSKATKKSTMPMFEAASGIFTKPRHVRRLSKRLVREHARKQKQRAMLNKLLTAVPSDRPPDPPLETVQKGVWPLRHRMAIDA